ncbi:hypothetical protein KFU94_55950 [Chloroflexi bacterium TSY]|nr:hypothetical protein [Chloroflexi bacterium TSY]
MKPSLRIKEIERITLRVPFTPRVQPWNALLVWQWQIVEIIRVTTEDGTVGYGETLPHYTWGRVSDEAIDRVKGHNPVELFDDDSLSRSKFGVFGDFQSRLQGFWSHLFRFRLQKTTYFISENRPNLTQKLDIDRQICIYVNCLARILSQNLKFGSTESRRWTANGSLRRSWQGDGGTGPSPCQLA